MIQLPAILGNTVQLGFPTTLTSSLISHVQSFTAMHDAIATTLCQCRRLIIILSSVDPGNGDQEGELLSYNLNQLCYEQKIGLYDALTRNDPKVILVEIGEDRFDVLW